MCSIIMINSRVEVYTKYYVMYIELESDGNGAILPLLQTVPPQVLHSKSVCFHRT